ncbi:MAG: protease complex subunit PrcB family protein [Planctomycetota bacterium]
MKLTTLGALLGALVLTPAAAWAQPAPKDIPFTSLGTSQRSGHTTAKQQVIQSKATYDAWYQNAGGPPATPTVDFTKEDVLAVAMGTMPTSGYAIEITKVEYTNFGLPPLVGVVHYKETKPTGFTLQVLTSPSHVVKVTKVTNLTKYIFVNDTAPAYPYDKLSFNVSWPFDGTSSTIEIGPKGDAAVYRSSPLAKYAPLIGTATAAELKAVNDAFTKANVKTLPANVADDRVFIIAPKAMQLESTIAGKAYTFSASLDYYKTYEARVKPLCDALKAISDRLLKAPATTFEKLSLTTEGGFVMQKNDYIVSWDGTVTVLNRIGMGPTRPFTGHATKAELDAIKAAFAAADATNLPAKITPTHMIPDVPSEKIVSTVNGTDYECLVVTAGSYAMWDARLKPLTASIRDCGQRVLKDALPQSITDVVTFTANVLKVGSFRVATNDTLYGTIFSLRGKKITITVTNATGVEYVTATMTTTSSLRKSAYWWGQSIETLQKGAQVQITGRSTNGQYYFVNSPSGTKGWVYAAYANAAN